ALEVERLDTQEDEVGAGCRLRVRAYGLHAGVPRGKRFGLAVGAVRNGDLLRHERTGPDERFDERASHASGPNEADIHQESSLTRSRLRSTRNITNRVLCCSNYRMRACTSAIPIIFPISSA